MKQSIRLVLAALALALAACTSGMRNAAPAGCRPSIYPDYTGVTIPTGIAPLDFALPGADRLEVRITAPDGTILQPPVPLVQPNRIKEEPFQVYIPAMAQIPELFQREPQR